MRAVSPTLANRSVLGVTVIFVAAPAMIVTVALTTTGMPVTLADTDALPAMVPAVICAVACPFASVTTEAGLTVTAPVAVKATVTPGTGTPFESDTFTVNDPAEDAPAALARRDVTSSGRVAGPGLLAPVEESEPHPAAVRATATRATSRRTEMVITSS